MTEPTDIEGRIAAQVNALASECGRQAFVWLMYQHQGREYVPPLFRNSELPIVPRLAMPRIEGAARREARR
jgi:hypothetical protein